MVGIFGQRCVGAMPIGVIGGEKTVCDKCGRPLIPGEYVFEWHLHGKEICLHVECAVNLAADIMADVMPVVLRERLTLRLEARPKKQPVIGRPVLTVGTECPMTNRCPDFKKKDCPL